MTGYVRVDTGNNIADGNVINAADLDNEFDGVQAAFNSSTGHTHDGTSGEGAPITKIGPVQDVVVSISAIYPKTTNTVDLGTSSLKYKDLYLAGNSLLGGTLGVTGAATFTGAIVSDSTTDSTSTVTGAIQTDGGLGVAKALWVGGLANIAGATTLQGTLTGSDATDSTSTVSGAFKTAGGLGVAKALWVGGLANIAGATTLQGTLGVTGVATFSAGSASAPALTTSGDTNTGVLFPAADTVGITTGGTERVRIDSSGNLGLGVTPSAWASGTTALQVKGTSLYSYSATNNFLSSNAYYNGTAWTYQADGAASQYQMLGAQHAWYTAASGTAGNAISFTQAATLSSVSNVTTYKLATAASGAGASQGFDITFANDAYLWNYQAATIIFGTNNTERARIDSSGNLGVGTSSPSYRLHASSATSATIIGQTNTSGTITYNMTGANLYLDSSVSSIYAFRNQAGTESMRIDSSGNVRIGGTSANIFARTNVVVDGTYGWGVEYYDTDASTNQTSFIIGKDSTTWFLNSDKRGTGTTKALAFQINGAEKARIDTSGRLLVGVTTGAGTANVDAVAVSGYASFQARSTTTGSGDGTTSVVVTRAVSNGASWWAQGKYDAYSHSWGVGPSASANTSMTLDASGNLGVGTTSPSYRIHSYKASGMVQTVVETAGSGAQAVMSVKNVASGMVDVGADAYGGYIQTQNAVPLLIYTNSTERARIDSSGSFMVGMTNFSGSFSNGVGLGIFSTGYTQICVDGSTALAIARTVSTGNVQTFHYGTTTTNATGVGSISVTGSATAYNTTSDYRLKNITGPVTGAKDFIMALKPKQGTWKIDGSKFVGFVAHEFQEVSPSSVIGEKDAIDKDGNPIMQAMQASTPEVMANLVALIQEQQAIIESLKARLDAANL